MAYHVSDLVDGLDLTAFYAPYEWDGRRNAPYEPRMMGKLLIYGYATGLYSCRGIAKKLEEDVAFRMVAAGNFPAHRTISEFRRRHLEEYRKLFVEVVGLAWELRLAKFGTLKIDGTKVRANTSKRKAMTYRRMHGEQRRLEAEIGDWLRRPDEVDAGEDARYGEDRRGDEIPLELRTWKGRLAPIPAVKVRLEATQRAANWTRGRKPGPDRKPKKGRPYKRAYGEPDPKAQSNFTDPKSGIMHTSAEGFQQRYNAQVTVDGANQLIVSTQVTANTSDQGQAIAQLNAMTATYGQQPETVLANSDYSNERDLAELEARGIDGYVAVGREGKTPTKRGDPETAPATWRITLKLATEAGRATCAKRKRISEAPHGWIKEVLGFRRFKVRGLRKVQGKWDLVSLALNVKRLQFMMVKEMGSLVLKRGLQQTRRESFDGFIVGGDRFFLRACGPAGARLDYRPTSFLKQGSSKPRSTAQLVPQIIHGADS